MRPLLALVLLALPAFAGPIGARDPHAAAATGFPAAYLGTVRLSLAGDPFFASRLLDAVQLHLKSLAVMTEPRAVGAYLEQAATLGQGDLAATVKPALGREAMNPPQASAILLANALARPDQFREVLDGLETLKPGLGAQTARLLRETDGQGDRRLLAALRSAGERTPRGEALTYGRDGRLNVLFDGARFGGAAPEDVVDVPASYDPAGRPRRNGLLPAPRR